MRRLEHRVDAAEDGLLLGTMLTRMGLSKRLIRRLKGDDQGILVDGRRATVRHLLRCGELVSVAASPSRSNHLTADDRPLVVFYEDADVLVCAKPAGVTMYPRYRGEPGAFSGAVLHHQILRGEAPAFFPIYRLDKNTSGVVVLAKNSFSARRLAVDSPEKIYQAVAFGRTPMEECLCAPLGRTAQAYAKAGNLFWPMANGKPCATAYRRIFYDAAMAASGLLVRLATGRRHQIRVHLAQRGYPLWGDVAYGGPPWSDDRHLLHVGCVQFTHPTSGASLRFFDPFPALPASWHDAFSEEVNHLDDLTKSV